MKKSLLFATTLLFLLSHNANAQQHILKVGTGSALRNICNIEYEYLHSANQTVHFELGFSMPYEVYSSLSEQLGFSTAWIETLAGRQRKVFYLVGEQRKYRQGDGKGFYGSYYAKIAYHDNSGDDPFIPSTFLDDVLNDKMISASVGVGFGFQWQIKDRIVINWQTISLGGSLNLTIERDSYSDILYLEQQRAYYLDRPEAPFMWSKGVFNEENLTSTIYNLFPFVALRSGFSIGYRF